MLSRSSAVLLCDIKRGLGVKLPGVDLPEGRFDAMVVRGGNVQRAEERWVVDVQRCEGYFRMDVALESLKVDSVA